MQLCIISARNEHLTEHSTVENHITICDVILTGKLLDNSVWLLFSMLLENLNIYSLTMKMNTRWILWVYLQYYCIKISLTFCQFSLIIMSDLDNGYCYCFPLSSIHLNKFKGNQYLDTIIIYTHKKYLVICFTVGEFKRNINQSRINFQFNVN